MTVILILLTLICTLIEFLRLIHIDSARIEFFTFFYAFLFFFSLLTRLQSLHVLYLKLLFSVLYSIILSIIHFAVTVLNFWYIFERFHKKILFRLTGFIGVSIIFAINFFICITGHIF
jgi:hypothetical protein